jgi:hypothetical protein
MAEWAGQVSHTRRKGADGMQGEERSEMWALGGEQEQHPSRRWEGEKKGKGRAKARARRRNRNRRSKR